MKRLILSEDNDGFSAQIAFDKKYLLSNQPEYNTQVIDLRPIIGRNYIKKHGIRLRENERLNVSFNRQGTFDVKIYENAGRDISCADIIAEDLKMENYFNLAMDLNGVNLILINQRTLPDVLVMDCYKLKVKEEMDSYVISTKKADSVELISNGGGLVFLLNEREVTMEEALLTFQNVFYDTNLLMEKLKEVSFNCHIRRKGICDIYEKFSSNYSIPGGLELEKEIRGYAQMAEEDFYLLCESYIKMELDMREVVKKLSIFTNKPLPSPKGLTKISKKTMDFIKKKFSERDRREQMERFSEMEKDPKIGPNNVHLMIDFFETLEKIEKKYSLVWDSGLSLSLCAEQLHMIGEIVHRFDCKVKNLIERAIRAIFQYGISPEDYFETVLDYHKLCKQLGIEPERKIPADVISLHDKYSLMVEDIKDKEVKRQFENKAEQNRQLIFKLPEDEQYTIVVPKETSDLVREGTYLNHCVGSYINQVADGSSKIFFLRRKESPDTPYVTVELTRNNLLYQAKGFSNSRPCKEDMNYIYKWMDLIGGTYDK